MEERIGKVSTRIQDKIKEVPIELKDVSKSKPINKNLFIFNNYIYWTHLDNPPIGHEQGLDRPCLIVRTTKESPICTIIPLTLERLNDNIPYHIDLSNGKSTALVEQIRTIDKSRIYNNYYYKKKQAQINEEDRKKLNEQIHKMYMLKEIYKKR